MQRNNTYLLLLFLLMSVTPVWAQITQEPAEQQLENLADSETGVSEDDLSQQDMDLFRRHPVNLNTADEATLRQFRILTDLQIHSFIQYRELLGKLLHVLELQSVPGWDIRSASCNPMCIPVRYLRRPRKPENGSGKENISCCCG